MQDAVTDPVMPPEFVPGDLAERPKWMEEPVSNALDAIPPDDRSLIEMELFNRSPSLLKSLRATQIPTSDQSDQVVDTLYRALSENYGPGHSLNERGKAIDNAIGAYLMTWPINRE